MFLRCLLGDVTRCIRISFSHRWVRASSTKTKTTTNSALLHGGSPTKTSSLGERLSSTWKSILFSCVNIILCFQTNILSNIQLWMDGELIRKKSVTTHMDLWCKTCNLSSHLSTTPPCWFLAGTYFCFLKQENYIGWVEAALNREVDLKLKKKLSSFWVTRRTI